MRVTDVLEVLAGGATGEEVVSDFPCLTTADVRACLAWAAGVAKPLARPKT